MKIRQSMFWMFKKIARLLWGKKLSRFPVINKMSSFLRVHLRPKDVEFVELEGDKLYAHPKSVLAFHVALFGTYEKLLREVFRKEIKPGMTVVDLGAHIGSHTLLAARLVGEKGKVFAFEPSPSNYTFLAKNVAENGYTNVIAVHKAVSDKATQLRLYLPDYSMGPPNPTAEFITVDSITLDEFFDEQNTPVDFIKMDIEGAEVAALEGMENLVRKNGDLKLVAEFNPEYVRNAGYSPEEFLHKLAEYGFALYDINEEKQSIEPTGVSSLLKAYDAKGKRTNLFCVREA